MVKTKLCNLSLSHLLSIVNDPGLQALSFLPAKLPGLYSTPVTATPSDTNSWWLVELGQVVCESTCLPSKIYKKNKLYNLLTYI